MSKALKIILAIVGLIALWLLTLYFKRVPIEQDLTDRVTEVLSIPEFSEVQVAFEGRDGALTGEVSSQALADKAGELAKKVWGVRVIDNQLAITTEQSATIATLKGYFQDGKFVLDGVIPDEAWRTKLMNLAERTFGTGKVVDQLSINASVQIPDLFEKAYTTFLGLKGIDEPGFSIMPDKFTLTGKVPKDEIKIRLGTGLTNTLIPLPVQNDLQVVAIEVGKPSLEDLVKFFATNPIEFDFGSSRLTSQSRQVLERAFELLKQVPEASFEIEGHTDNIGAHDYNMRLSRARAIAVRLYLLEKGMIQPERLSVSGYGEKQPKSTNDTEEGRQRNRRVEFRVKSS